MGNADLRDIAVIETHDIDDIAGSTVAVDASNWLYKYITTTTQWTDTDIYTADDGTEVPHLLGGFRGLPRFFEQNIEPVFVFDGLYHEFKEDELAERREVREAAADAAERAHDEGNEVLAARLEARSKRLTDTVIETTKHLLDHLDIPHMTAPQAAEAQAAHLGREGVVEYVVSEDYDALLYGAPQTVRGFTASGSDVELLSLDATLDEHSLSWRRLVDVGLLCGTDYNDGVHGVGPATALSGVRKHGDIETVLDERDDALDRDVDILRNIFLDPSVSNEWVEPRTPAPDLIAARTYLVDNWGIPEEELDTAFERFEDATQAGLDRWS